MRKIVVILLLCIGALQGLHAQYYFNKRETLHSASTILTSVVPRDGKYYCTGVCVDSMNMNDSGQLYDITGVKFAIFDSVGNVIRDTVYQQAFVRDLYAWNNSLYAMPDKGFVYAVGIDADTAHYGRMMLLRYDSVGNVQWAREYDPPFCGGGLFYSIVDMKPTGTGEWLTLATQGCYVNGNSGPKHGSLVLAKLDSNFNTEWSKQYGDVDYNNVAAKIYVTDSGYLLGGCVLNQATIHMVYRAEIIKTDTAGNQLWSWLSDANKKINTVTMDLIQTKDGGYMYCGQEGYEEDYAGNGFMIWSGWVEKLDANRNVVWHDTVSRRPSTVEATVQSVIKEQSDSSIILAGQVVGGFAENDTSIYGFGSLVKFSLDGHRLSTRKYSVINDTLIYRVYDMKPTADGGYVFVGENDDDYFPYTYPKQRGWIVKVDSNGCLGPDDTQCHPVDVRTVQRAREVFRIYPNPSNGELIASTGTSLGGEIVVYSMTGREIYGSRIRAGEQKHISLHVPDGVCEVVFVSDDGERSVQRVVITNR